MGFTAAAFLQRVHESTEDDAASEKVAETVGTLSSRSGESGHVADPLHDFYLKKTTFRSVFNAELANIETDLWTQLAFFLLFCKEKSTFQILFFTKNFKKKMRKSENFFLDLKK